MKMNKSMDSWWIIRRTVEDRPKGTKYHFLIDKVELRNAQKVINWFFEKGKTKIFVVMSYSWIDKSEEFTPNEKVGSEVMCICFPYDPSDLFVEEREERILEECGVIKYLFLMVDLKL